MHILCYDIQRTCGVRSGEGAQSHRVNHDRNCKCQRCTLSVTHLFGDFSKREIQLTLKVLRPSGVHTRGGALIAFRSMVKFAGGARGGCSTRESPGKDVIMSVLSLGLDITKIWERSYGAQHGCSLRSAEKYNMQKNEEALALESACVLVALEVSTAAQTTVITVAHVMLLHEIILDTSFVGSCSKLTKV